MSTLLASRPTATAAPVGEPDVEQPDDHHWSLPLALLRPILLGVVAQACAVGLLVVSAWLLSKAALHPPVLYLMTTVVAVRALGIGRGVLRYRERLAGHDVALRLQARLRMRTFTRLADGATTRRRGDLLSRLITDIDAVQDLVVRVLVPIISAALVMVATVAVITVISPAAGVLLSAGSVLSGVLLPWLTARLSATVSRTRAPLRAGLADEITTIAHSRLDLVAYGAAPAAIERLAAIDGRLAAAERRAAQLAGLATGVQWLVTGAVVIGSMVVAGEAVARGDLAPVLLAVLALTPLALHEVVAALPAATQAGQRCRSALVRVQELIMTGSSAVPAAGSAGVVRRDPSAAPLVETVGLTVGWSEAAPLVRGIDLRVGAGDRVALVGPSGVGKSTVAATLMGDAPVLAGRATVHGRIGYLAQDAHVFDTTVAENVRIGLRDASDTAVRSALNEVGLEHLELEQLVGEFGAAVSGGEARRLACARLLVADCSVLIMDEPTEHLDRASADGIIELIMTVRPSAAVLVITHDPVLIARCDRSIDLRRS
ncbi:thiol reductant ABC exporter subunit CydC [Microlunatus soli]|uniref:ATP-binding cassette, subfamily C, CydC n=1 Tax=Microlunatus soli TaxID=630515 RepID=A0A1H1UZ77_9ACTN|nr:thiol reductant ABC exporter subunit CydC [Microlunatus soli]SDS77406.1 ATP-binding cassette, subfamily C, CydC [Microlunatus soli]